jgi:hypothetical protein
MLGRLARVIRLLNIRDVAVFTPSAAGRVEPNPDKHGEAAVIMAPKGSADYYTIQYADRTPSVDKLAIDNAKWPQ